MKETSPFYHVDRWLLIDNCQLLSDWTSRFGVTNFTLMRIAGGILILLMAAVSFQLAQHGAASILGAALALGAVSMVVVAFHYDAKRRERYFLSGSTKTRNPLELEAMPYRIALMLVAFAVTYMLVTSYRATKEELFLYLTPFPWLTLLMAYFISCTPKPKSPLKAGNRLAEAAA